MFSNPLIFYPQSNFLRERANATMSVTNLPFPPLTLYATSSVTFLLSVQLSQRARILLAPLLFGTAIASMRSSTYLSWAFPGAPSYWNLMLCIWMHHVVSILYIEPFHLPASVGSEKERWLLAGKIWNDRQCRLQWSTYLQTRDSRPTTVATRLWFALKRLAKFTVAWSLQLRVIGPAVTVYFGLSRAHFAPAFHPFVRRIMWHDPGVSITAHEVELRSFMAVYWIWLAYLLLDGAHVLLSVLFVSILHLDPPEEWPPLFGSLLYAYSIRGFWGKFWHRVASPACARSGRLVTRRILGLMPRSGAEKLFIAFWTFFISGVFHAVADWQGGEAVMPLGEMRFWLLNFVACAVEMLVANGVKGCWKGNRLGCAWKLDRLTKAFGFVWVFSFFFWVVPKWQYPKLYHALSSPKSIADRDLGLYYDEGFFQEDEWDFFSILDGFVPAGNRSSSDTDFVSFIE